MSLMIFEIIAYIIFIYALCFLFIFIKPNMPFLIALFLICFVGSWLVLIDCKMASLNNIIFKFFVLVTYSTICTLIYLLIHNNWSNLLCKIFVFALPLLFYLMIKTVENLFQCDKYHIFTSPVRFGDSIIKILLQLNDKIKNQIK